MESYVFYCPKCQNMLAGEFSPTSTPARPKCKTLTVSAGKSKEDWFNQSKALRDETLEYFKETYPYKDPSRPKLFKEQYADKEDTPKEETIIQFASHYCPRIPSIQVILALIAALGIFIALISLMAGGNMVGISIGLSMLGAAIGAFVDLYVACWFYKAAILKGHTDSALFWIAFVLTIPGYLLVASMPDRNPQQ